MKTPLTTLLLLLALGSVVDTQSQLQPAQKPTVQAIVGDVSDNRTTAKRDSSCVVELKFVGDATTDALDIVRLRATKATDDLHNDLSSRETENHNLLSSVKLDREPGPPKGFLFLENPSRRANFIKVLEGEVELYCPTIANGGQIKIQDFFKNPPTPIQNPMLKRLGLEVVFMTRETFQARKAEFSRNPKMYGNSWSDSKIVAKVYVKDTNRILRRVDVKYADGTDFAAQSTAYLDEARAINFTALPPSGSHLMFTTFAPGTKQTYPFKLENIPLP